MLRTPGKGAKEARARQPMTAGREKKGGRKLQRSNEAPRVHGQKQVVDLYSFKAQSERREKAVLGRQVGLGSAVI